MLGTGTRRSAVSFCMALGRNPETSTERVKEGREEWVEKLNIRMPAFPNRVQMSLYSPRRAVRVSKGKSNCVLLDYELISIRNFFCERKIEKLLIHCERWGQVFRYDKHLIR